LTYSLQTPDKGRYGSPRIYDQLIEEKWRVSRKRVSRLMREDGLVAFKKKRTVKTTDSKHDKYIHKNIVQRNFKTKRPNQIWASDITYVRTWEGWVYLAVIMDIFSRRIVGWFAANHMREELALEALERALGARVLEKHPIHHSDRGVQYAANEYQRILKSRRIQCSMSGKGNCFDNAVVESFFATLKKELVYRNVYRTRREAIFSINEYISMYYNCKRKHSTLGNKTPMQYEEEVNAMKKVA